MAYTRSPAQPQPTSRAPGKPANPTRYDESLRARCFPYRFRKVGSPYAYLDEIGIAAMCEFIVKGHLLIDVAEATDVPFDMLRSWVQENGYQEAIDEATIYSAEGFLAEGMRGLRHAATDFELRRAREIVRQAQFLAEKKDKAQYGKKDDPNQGKAVQYVFNIGAPTTIQATPLDPDDIYKLPPAKQAPLLEGTSKSEDVSRRGAVEYGSMEGVSAPDTGFAFALPTRASGRVQPERSEGVHDNGVHKNVPKPDTPRVPPQKALPHMLAHLTAFDPDRPPPSGRKPVKPEHDPNLILTYPRPARPTPENPDIGPFYDEICVSGV